MRKLIPQTINFVSKTALQNVAWGRREFFFILFYSPNYTVTLEILNLVNLKSACATKPEVWYRFFLLSAVVANPFNEELLTLKRFYL